MALTADYKCDECSEMFEYRKEYKENFPQSSKCPKCGSTSTFRKYGISGVFVREGNVGNSGNGYTSR
jgi:putative FmdB family regulatory protein